MDFVTTQMPPVRFRIDGVWHEVPRFLLPQMAQWMEELRQKTSDNATAHLSPDDKARFLMYFQPPLYDVSEVAQDIRTPKGMIELLHRQLPLATPPVTSEKIDALCESNDPQRLRLMVEMIASVKVGDEIVRQQSGEEEKSEDPLAEQRPKSADTPSTGSKSKHKSEPRTPASTLKG